MKLSLIGGVLICAMSLAPSAHAEQHGGTYATIKAVFDYCERVDESHREQYATLAAHALASVSAGGDAGDYQAVYNAVGEKLTTTPEATGRATCAAGIPAGLVKVNPEEERERR